MDGSGSNDPDGTIASYSWTQTAGASVTLSDANSKTPSFTAPDVGSDGDTLIFELTVTDSDGATATDSVDVKVNNVIVNQPPVASLTANPTTIEEGSTSTLDASASTDDVGIVQYTFEQVGGTAGTITVDSTDPSKATFNAPSVSADETATIKLTVKDAEDATDSTTVEIAVTNVVHATTLTLNTITNVPWGKDITVTGKLIDNIASGAGGVSGATISFDGTGADNLPDAVTNTDGTFTMNGASPATAATGWTYQAHFAENDIYNKADSAIKTYSTSKHSISLTLNLYPTTVASGAVYKVSGVLKDISAGGVAISSKTISFTPDSPITIADQTTDTTGTNIVKPTAPSTAGTYNIQSHFASDSLYNAKDSLIKPLTVS